MLIFLVNSLRSILANMKYYYTYNTIYGPFSFVEMDGYLIQIGHKEMGICKETPLLKEAFHQVNDYFKGIRKEFDLPIQLIGTEFQVRVWKALCTISYGHTASYKDIARLIGNEKASRAVGMANHVNPLPFVIPCHRIIGSNGKLTGYAFGLEVKEKLLKMEGIL